MEADRQPGRSAVEDAPVDDRSRLERVAFFSDAVFAIAATWVLPGHGEAWSGGLAEALRQIRAAAAS
jgi:hypothetical protein